MKHGKFWMRRPISALLAGMAAVAVAAGGAVASAEAKAAPLPVGAATRATLIPVNKANWSAQARFSSSRPAWFKDSSGVIHLQGAARQFKKTGPNASLLGTLPGPARPARNVVVVVHTLRGTYADLQITRSGQINVIKVPRPLVTDLRFVSLEGVTFRPTSGGRAIGLNGANFAAVTGPGSQKPAFYQDRSDIVHLEGAARQISKSGPGANFLGTLPARARPARNVFVIVATAKGTYADAEIAETGQINLIDPFGFAKKDFGLVSLDGVSYSPGAIFNSLAPPFPGLNTNNWSLDTKFGSSDPGWNEDSAGVIHLQGGVSQKSLSGDATLIATLPQIIWPGRNVFTIVHTFNGTFADLVIMKNGQVRLIDPRSPASKDYSFVSLEGVTYRP